ncbi:hypothetical protein HPB50_020392 [Hyalomma asiaticum]|uniref:Uncharacterized protein n=1 Tax=Hyalomma asiaticum TaxID=266040 RepID=A0ACB7RJA0_HYAAI|nr:hypothetical protein HPB50_020392 [Hyalomma asiaticum]
MRTRSRLEPAGPRHRVACQGQTKGGLDARSLKCSRDPLPPTSSAKFIRELQLTIHRDEGTADKDKAKTGHALIVSVPSCHVAVSCISTPTKFLWNLVTTTST